MVRITLCRFSIIRAISSDLKRVAPVAAGARDRRTGCHRAGASLDRSQHPGAARKSRGARDQIEARERESGGAGGRDRVSKSNEEADTLRATRAAARHGTNIRMPV